ncbi:hypothetical protein [Flammeovirga aprica]|uniref:Transposase InsH N-terminal domain-containing protein n=1 Tax=Flammeovirga aprica JL-4 TaxID=694437 RepID=A0A7X9P393_9BACT|nr:hypothetical protein [Flammeovirga aprica]NME67814.1 hypothetical protein [Flammeovirga aprica JL-4]
MQFEIFKSEQAQPLKYYKFKNSELGKIHSCIPWEELEQLLPSISKKAGRKSWFNNRGKLALMFLKSYSGLSDEKLIDRLNTDWAYQMFCFRFLKVDETIKDITLPSTTRSYISSIIDVEELQFSLLKHWKGAIEFSNLLLMDATCYESDVRYPTDVKLLWESCHYIFEKLLFRCCEELKIKRPRSKYVEQKRKYLTYFKRRRKGYKLTRKRKRSLLYSNFKKKGPKPYTKEENSMVEIIAKERSTRMEGIFGTHKRSYGLGKIKARTEANEKLWIVFGILTSNAVLLAKKKETKLPETAQGRQLKLAV